MNVNERTPMRVDEGVFVCLHLPSGEYLACQPCRARENEKKQRRGCFWHGRTHQQPWPFCRAFSRSSNWQRLSAVFGGKAATLKCSPPPFGTSDSASRWPIVRESHVRSSAGQKHSPTHKGGVWGSWQRRNWLGCEWFQFQPTILWPWQ